MMLILLFHDQALFFFNRLLDLNWLFFTFDLPVYVRNHLFLQKAREKTTIVRVTCLFMTSLLFYLLSRKIIWRLFWGLSQLDWHKNGACVFTLPKFHLCVKKAIECPCAWLLDSFSVVIKNMLIIVLGNKAWIHLHQEGMNATCFVLGTPQCLVNVLILTIVVS